MTAVQNDPIRHACSQDCSLRSPMVCRRLTPTPRRGGSFGSRGMRTFQSGPADQDRAAADRSGRALDDAEHRPDQR